MIDSIKIDTINEEFKTFSLCIKSINEDGNIENWRRGYCPGELDKLNQDLLERCPDYDYSEIINQAISLWTEEIVESYQQHIENENAKRIQMETEAAIQNAEIEAYKENELRNLIASILAGQSSQ